MLTTDFICKRLGPHFFYLLDYITRGSEKLGFKKKGFKDAVARKY